MSTSLSKNNSRSILPPLVTPLTPFQNLIYQLGGILLIVGAILPLVPSFTTFAPYVFTTGCLMFSTMQLQQRYEGRDITVRRLRRQQIVGAFLLLISACLMLMKWFHLGPLRGDEWKLTLAIAALLQLYTAFRLPAALNKSEK